MTNVMQHPLVMRQPWGEEEIWAMVPNKYCAKRLHVKGGRRLSLEYHSKRDETLMLESGDAYLLLGQTLATLDRIELKVGQSVHVPPLWFHRLCAVKDSTLMEVSTPELEDTFRVDDDYGR